MEEFNKKTDELKNLCKELKSTIKEARSLTKQKEYKAAITKIDDGIKNIEGIRNRLKDTKVTVTSFLLGSIVASILISIEYVAVAMTLIAAPVVAVADLISHLKVLIENLQEGKIAEGLLDTYRTMAIKYCDQFIVVLKIYKKYISKKI